MPTIDELEHNAVKQIDFHSHREYLYYGHRYAAGWDGQTNAWVVWEEVRE